MILEFFSKPHKRYIRVDLNLNKNKINLKMKYLTTKQKRKHMEKVDTPLKRGNQDLQDPKII